MNMDNDRLMTVALAWGQARVEALRLRAERAAHRCDYHDPGETAPCYLGSEDAVTDWCEECQKRLPIHRLVGPARQRERALFRRLDTLVRRAVTRQPEGAA